MRAGRRKSIALFAAAAATISSSLASQAWGGAFIAPTDLLVLQTNGDGGSSFSADSVTLNEYNPSVGFTTPVNTINLPTTSLSYDGTSGLGLTLPDSSDHDGQLTLSQDGHQLVFGTYLSAIGGVDYFGTDVGPNDVPASQVPRVITVLHPDGTIDDSTQLTGADDYNSVSIRQVSSLNGTQFWSVGNGVKPSTEEDIGGIRYSTLGSSTSTSMNIQNDIDARSLAIFQGQMYVSGGSVNNPTGDHTMSLLGSGINTTPQPWNVIHSNGGNNPDGTIFGTTSPQFVTLNNGNIELYKSDSTNGNLEKYSLINGTWTLEGEIVFGKDLIENIAVSVVGNSTNIYVDNTTALYQFTDTGGAGPLAITGESPVANNQLRFSINTPILTSSTDGLRGISFAPSTSAAVGNQIWASASGASWNAASSWADGIPNASGATATFGPATPGLAANGLITLDANQTVGHIVFNNASASYNISAGKGGSLTINNTDPNATGVPSIYNESGTHTISAPIALTAGVTVSSTFNSATTISGPISGSGGVSVYGLGQAGAGITQAMLGVVTFSGANTYAGGTTVNNGTLVIQPTGSTTSALPKGNVTINGGLLDLSTNVTLGSQSSPTPASNVNITSLSITGNGTLDINNNHIIINYGSGADPISSIAALIKSGFNGGAWTGFGITSSAAQSNSGSYGIGYADAADPGNPAGLSSGQIEIMYTLLGDANLDGAVNGSDFAIMATDFNKADLAGHSGWDEGDFNYDGSVNGSDFAELASNFNKGASQSAVSTADAAALDSFASASGFLADVPEPTCAALLGICSSALFLRRRRTQGKI